MCADKVAIDDGREHSESNWNQPGPPTAIANHHITMQHRLFIVIKILKKEILSKFLINIDLDSMNMFTFNLFMQVFKNNQTDFKTVINIRPL